MTIKTTEEKVSYQDFIQDNSEKESNTLESQKWRLANWSPNNLRGLKIQELETMWTDIEHQTGAINDQAKMMIWHICLRIRKFYPSDRLMGEYLNELRSRDPTHPLMTGCTQQTRNKWANAAQWCSDMRITSLPEEKLTQQAVFILSSPANKEVSKKVYKQIKGKSMPSSEIERIVNTLKAVNLVTTAPSVQPVAAKYEQMALPEVETAQELALTSVEPFERLVVGTVEDMNEDRNQVSDEQMAQDILDFCAPYRRNFMQLNGVLKIAQSINTAKGYGK
jgi:hypothetical protein